MKRNRNVAAVLLLAGLTVGCQDARLDQVAKGLNEAAASVSILQTTVIDAEAHGLLTEDQTRPILEGSIKVNQAGQEAVAITRALSKLDPASQNNLLAILNPVIASVNELVANGTVGITDEATRQKIQLLLLTIQTTLNTIQLTLTTGGN